MKTKFEEFEDEKKWETPMIKKPSKYQREQLNAHELDELREHIDLISFNIGKVYHHAKVRQTMKKKLHHSYKNEKIRI